MTANQIEKIWVDFQINVAAARRTLGPLYQGCHKSRHEYTFVFGEKPKPKIARVAMGCTDGQPNGIPDITDETGTASYAARLFSVVSASAIIHTIDSMIQKLAQDLGQPTGRNMFAGDNVRTASGEYSVKASQVIWAAANAFRHLDEWYATSESYQNPKSPNDLARRTKQNYSMEPLATVLGCALPITENVAFEVFQVLTEIDETSGSFDRLELHVLRVGQDLVHQAGLPGAPIGISLLGVLPMEAAENIPAEHIHMSDGIMRSASSLPDTGRLLNVKPPNITE